ncbi:hypothetical protein ACIQ6Y_00460 [Streptomyces sp. NPDC096205]|uniref:hypothetical protein n=1 Tax=Streptomyces sp. NPDC096205 TaxID=3366081 RepID=UPI0037F822B9
MPSSPTVRPMTPPTVWLARGRHVGPGAEGAVRARLRQLADAGTLDGQLEVPPAEGAQDQVFEARWRPVGEVTVRARLTLATGADGGRTWTLAAEAERAWDAAWPSPAQMFWPQGTESEWAHESGSELSLTELNPLPEDEKELRRVLKGAAQAWWAVHVVVHEAMTPDERGRKPLAGWLPVGLRHRVVEHRAAPHQLRAVNYALRDLGVQLPRGGAVVLPGDPAPAAYDGDDLTVRSVFLDGSEPAELTAAVTRFAALPRPLAQEAEEALTALREDWRLLTLEEELARERKLVAMYAEALEAMTKSRDLYREAAEQAHEALAACREAAGNPPPAEQPAATSPFQHLTRTLERLRGSSRARRTDEAGAAGQEGSTAG